MTLELPSGPATAHPSAEREPRWWRRPSGRAMALLWVVLVAAVLLDSRGVLMVDTKPEVYLAPWRTFRAFLSPWQENPQLGFASFNVGLAPVAAAVGLLQSLGLSPALSVRVLKIVLLTAGGLGAARLFRTLAPADPVWVGWGAAAAAAAYVANPYVVVAGATLPIQWPFAVLPWLMWALVRAVETGRGWKWPAVVVLLFAATTGMNAGVVALIQLVAAPALVVLAAARGPVPLRRVVAILARILLLVVLVSAYWLVPTVAGLGAGETVVGNSETVAGVGAPSSMAEVLRGLGLWPLYGRDSAGPWVPEHVGYLRSPPLLVLSFSFLVLVGASAALARGRVRVACVVAFALTALVMVGVHPVDHPTPLGAALRWAFAHVPGLAAFRTTNKAGASLVLMAALLVGLAASRAGTWGRGRRRLAAGAALLALLGSASPALTGNLFTSPMQIPSYWRQAAADLDTGPARQRVWFVPGEVSAAYRWTRERPDEVSNSLLSRPALVRTVIPATGAAAANLLAAADSQLQDASMTTAGLSTYARYLGVGDVLLRNDVVWEQSAGARPATLQPVVDGDPGLRAEGTYGRPGENTVSPVVAPLSSSEAALPPLEHWSVAEAAPPLHASALEGAVVLVGDGYAVSAAQEGGLLPSGTQFRYLDGLAPEALREVLGARHRLVLTDTNRRRTIVPGRLVGGYGPLLAAGADPGPTRALGTVRDQTVLRTEGGKVRASQVGGAFGPVQQAAPENAVDGDDSTSWQFGDFRRAAGATLVVTRATSAPLDRVVVRAARLGPVSIGRVRVSAGAASRSAEVGAGGRAVVDLGGVRARKVRIEVVALRGKGFNRVGIAEIAGLDLRVTRVASLPRTLQDVAAGGGPDLVRLVHETPLDVVLGRVAGTPADPTDDEEHALERSFALPDARTFRIYGVARPDGPLPEQTLDLLAGASGRVRAESSSYAFDDPSVRASAAFDGDPATAWVPGGDAVGESVTVSGPRRLVRRVDLRQPPRSSGAGQVTRVRVALDGRPVAESAVLPGRTRIDVPPRRAAAVTVTVLSRSGPGAVRIEEVGVDGRRVDFAPERAATACLPVATLDGQPLLAHPVTPVTGAQPVLLSGCRGDGTDLEPGAHRVSRVPGWTVDRLVLRDVRGESVVQGGDVPRLSVRSTRPTSYRVRAGAAPAPWSLVLGQSFDPRWRASADGRDLGPPELVDGYSVGWTLAAGGPTEITVRYSTQRLADIAIAVSLVALVVALALAVRPGTPPSPRTNRVATAPAVPGRPRRWRLQTPGRRAAWLLGLAVALIVGSWWLALATLGLAVLGLTCRLPAAVLVWSGVACWGVLPVAWVWGSAGRWGEVTPELVTGNPWPHVIAFIGLLLVVVGVVRDEWEGRPAASGTLGSDV